MKLNIFAALALSAVLFASCGENKENETVVEESAPVESATYTIQADASTVNWKGEVAGVYGHSGYVNFESATVDVAGDQIVGGTFVVDMSAIYPTDSSYEYNEKSNPENLASHLANEDFFNTSEFPTATFTITSVEGNNVTGDFTVRGKTNSETLNVTNLEMTDRELKLAGTLVFDRQKYDVAWVHFMKDMVLSDDISLNVSVVATK